MTGSAVNVDSKPIMVGMPIFEEQTGVRLPSANESAFAVATDSALKGGIVNYTTSDVVERRDWQPITGTKTLLTGMAYYHAGGGALSLMGAQIVGVALSTTQLRVNIRQMIEKVARIIPVDGTPQKGHGRDGDFAFDNTAKALYGPKKNGRWGEPSYMVQASQGNLYANNLKLVTVS